MALVFGLYAAAFSDGDAGRESAFSLGAGARGMGMGRVFTPLSGDASASFWNPAAASTVEKTSFTAFRATLFMNTSYDCLGVTHPFVDLGVVSFTFGRIGTDGIERRDIDNIPMGTFSSSETRFGFGYARYIGFGLRGGLNFKAVSQSVDGFSDTGVGADLGLQYNLSRIRWLTLGASFIDLLQPRIKLSSVEDRYATVSRLGLSGKGKLGDKMGLIAGFDFEKSGNRSGKIHLGAELGFQDQYFLRLGLDKDRPTFGAGLSYRNMSLDYAFEDIQYLGGSHRISFSYSFGTPVSEKRLQRRARLVKEERDSWEKSITDQADSLQTLADSLQAAGKYQEALGNYQKALGLNPGSQRASTMSDSMMNLIISMAISNVGDSRRQEMISARIESALNDVKEGRLNEAILNYKIILEIDPGNETVSGLLATAEQSRTKAISDSRAAAMRLQSQGDLAGATAEWARLLTIDENNSEAKGKINELKSRMQINGFIANAVGLINDGNYSSAISELHRAEQIKPGDKTVESLLSEATAKSVPPTTVEDIKSNPEDWNKYLSGLESYQKSDYRKAIEIWTELEKTYPNNSDLRKNISQARQRLSAEGGTQ